MMSVLNEARSIIIRTPHCVFLGLDGVLPTSITRVTLKRYGLEPEIPKETFDRKTWTRLMSILFCLFPRFRIATMLQPCTRQERPGAVKRNKRP